jgi:hypothetical protein
VSDIGLFYVIMKTETDEKSWFPTFYKKSNKNKFRKIIAVILLLCFLFHYPNKSFRVDILESDNYVYLITYLSSSKETITNYNTPLFCSKRILLDNLQKV